MFVSSSSWEVTHTIFETRIDQKNMSSKVWLLVATSAIELEPRTFNDLSLKDSKHLTDLLFVLSALNRVISHHQASRE